MWTDRGRFFISLNLNNPSNYKMIMRFGGVSSYRPGLQSAALGNFTGLTLSLLLSLATPDGTGDAPLLAAGPDPVTPGKGGPREGHTRLLNLAARGQV